MSTTTTTETEAIILTGEGYELSILPEIIRRKDELVTGAALVETVADPEGCATAQRNIRNLADLRILVEKSRKEVKEPVNRIAKLIDKAAKDFSEGIIAHENRIKKLVGFYSEEQARIKAEKEAAERRIAEEARRKREEADAAAAKAEDSNKLADVIAAKQAEAARQAALAERMAAAEETHATKQPEGVRMAWDFEVTDIAALYAGEPDLCELTPKRAAILAALKELESEGIPVVLPGIRAFKKPVVSTR